MPPLTGVLNGRRVLKDRRLFQVAKMFQAELTVVVGTAGSRLFAFPLSTPSRLLCKLELELERQLVQAPFISRC